jgi:hypothetical protein
MMVIILRKFLFVLILSALLSGCGSNGDLFAVYLQDTNKLIFSEEDIVSYEHSIQTFVFTPEGAEKMKSYQTSSQIDNGLYQKSFIAKLGDEEIYSGKFWTNLSSLSESGIVMYDVVVIGPDYNTFTVASSYPSEDISPENKEKINDPRIIEHFKNINKLK